MPPLYGPSVATRKGLFLVLFSVRCAAVHMRQQDCAYRFLPR
ncbi:hypothetical protein [Nocardiopsis listeri]|nr:hypothetical protein [Nocardiopsis listeri]